MLDKLTKYVCKNPFVYLDAQGENGSYICCPSWCPTKINETAEEIGWNSQTAKEIRKSVADGSYRYCNKQVCPSLNTLINTEEVPNNFWRKKDFDIQYNIETLEDVENIECYPEQLLFGFDRSCNLQCPSCRLDFVPNFKKGTKQYDERIEILKTIENSYSKYIREILITGSGDPFYSNIYREYLQNFDKTKYPSLDIIKLITNGQMLNKKMWDSLSCKEYIKAVEVSIDAGKKETYEGITRLRGNWDILISNLKFLSTLDSVDDIYLSFVVSEKNYDEMFLFYQTMMDIFKDSKVLTKRFSIVYRQHVHWEDGAYTEKEVESIQVFNKSHKLYQSFLNELDKIHTQKFVEHNFHHLIKKNLI